MWRDLCLGGELFDFIGLFFLIFNIVVGLNLYGFFWIVFGYNCVCFCGFDDGLFISVCGIGFSWSDKVCFYLNFLSVKGEGNC